MVEFTWDLDKEQINIAKHGVDFETARKAFLDPYLRIFLDPKHSADEERFFCVGKIDEQILTVRFTYREGKIRIFGAGYWRKGRAYYESKKKDE